MSGSAKVRFEWAGEEREFRLAIGQLRELQEKTGVGPLVTLRRLMDGTWHVDDVREAILLGLIGGGMNAAVAAKLVSRFVDPYPLAEAVPVARDIVMAAVIGVPEDPVGKPTAETAATEATASPSPH